MAPTRRRRSTRSPGAGAVTRTQELPTEHANELLSGFKGKLHTVKTQELKLEDGTTILIARVKVPTPRGISGHLIRRFDTDALSASSLFRAAFPNADDEAEQAEMAYLVKRYNTKVAGDEDEAGSGKLTGTWVPTEDATNIAKEYGLTKFASELISYEVTGEASNGLISSPAAPTPRKSKSPAPAPSSARGKRQRVMSPPMPTRSSLGSNVQPLQAPVSNPTTPSKSTRSKAAAASEPMPPVPALPADLSEPESTETGGIQVTQEIITDITTGEFIEETKVTFTGKAGKAALEGEDGTSSAQGLIGSEEQAREAAENALRLIESLKEQGTLQSSTSKRGREEEEEVAEEAAGDEPEESEQAQRGMLKRLFGRKPKKAAKRQRAAKVAELGELQVMQSPDGAQVLVAHTAAPPQPEANRRRYVAMAGMVVMGAATAAAPYFFG